MAESRKAERQPWNRSTRLNEAPKRSTKSGEEDTEAAATDFVTAAGDANGSRSGRRSRRTGRPTSQRTTARATMPSGRRKRSISREDAGNIGEAEREQTRAMIERAVSAAFGTVLTDRSSSFELDDGGGNGVDEDYAQARLVDKDVVLDPCRQSHDKENSQMQQRRSPEASTPSAIFFGRQQPEEELRTVLDKQNALRDTGRCRHEQYQQSNAQTQLEARDKREFYCRLSAAAVEFHARKHAIQSLYERVQREIQYLTATASDLDKRQLLLEDAFTSYERALRAEYDQQEDS